MNKYLIILLIAILVSCGTETTNSQDGPVIEKKAASSNEILDDKRRIIDGNEDQFDIANSLAFTHNDGSAEEVFAYLDKNQAITKIEERFTDGKTENSGKRIFYLENGKKFMSVEIFADFEKAKGVFRERVSYYNPAGEVLSTKERLSEYEADLEKETFVHAKNYNCTMDRAEKVLNNKGVFATTFQGFVDNGHMSYLIVGGPGESGFASALAIQFEDKQIKKLKSNEVAFINTPMSVQFEKMLDDRGLEFQVLLSMKME